MYANMPLLDKRLLPLTFPIIMEKPMLSQPHFSAPALLVAKISFRPDPNPTDPTRLFRPIPAVSGDRADPNPTDQTRLLRPTRLLLVHLPVVVDHGVARQFPRIEARKSTRIPIGDPVVFFNFPAISGEFRLHHWSQTPCLNIVNNPCKGFELNRKVTDETSEEITLSVVEVARRKECE
ncbi:uncharacterized protein LOC126782031 [Argentina anserina]|uniref:uncharacterized protein LOC126782031 n=1 Tax=Argentina anserina TaxID=57926 RepID=UPI0021767DDB|nr:uncharacterized protein LOC126782031 [Potentilla anserina]